MSEGQTIEQRLDAVLVSTEKIRGEIANENRKRDQRIRWSRRMIGAVFLVAVVAVIVAVFARNDLRESNRNTTAARIASCKQQNIATQQSIRHEERGNVILANNIAPLPRSAETQRRVDNFLAQENAETIAARSGARANGYNGPYRDCTPAGVSNYLRTQQHVATTLPPSTKG